MGTKQNKMKQSPIFLALLLASLMSFTQKKKTKSIRAHPVSCNCITFPRSLILNNDDTLPAPRPFPQSLEDSIRFFIWGRSKQQLFPYEWPQGGAVWAPLRYTDTINFEDWPGKGVSINADTLTISGDKITVIMVNGVIYHLGSDSFYFSGGDLTTEMQKALDSLKRSPSNIFRIKASKKIYGQYGIGM